MSLTAKPLFATATAITITLNSLVNTGTATSDAIDNSGNLYDEVELEVAISGTTSATAWLDVRIVKSIDGTNYGTWESATILPPIPLAVTPQRYHCRFTAPLKWKLMVKNNTGNALGGSGNSASYQGINPQGV